MSGQNSDRHYGLIQVSGLTWKNFSVRLRGGRFEMVQKPLFDLISEGDFKDFVHTSLSKTCGQNSDD